MSRASKLSVSAASSASSRYSRSSQSTHSSLGIDSVLANAQAREREGTLDSGYESPRPVLPLAEAHQRWKAADDAARALAGLRRAIEECSAQVAAAKTRLRELESPRALKKKPSFMGGILGKQKASATLDAASAAQTLADARSSVEEPEWRLARLQSELDQKKYAADRLDDTYEMLKCSVANGPMPSWRFDEGNEREILRAEKSVARVEAAFDDSDRMTEAFRVAQQAIQSAHHHYDKSMYLLEGVCGTNRSKLAVIMADEESKQATYKEAAQWAEKAQKCFNECARRLDAVDADLLSDAAQDMEELRQAGLLQAVQLYNLNYGGKALQFGIATQMQIMLQKQDAVFQRLTNFAVWVQNSTGQAEAMHAEVREKRDGARRRLVALWMNDRSASDASSPRSPASPTSFLP